jgi:hypothetical protein
MPVAIDGNLHGHSAFFDAEIAFSGQVRGQVGRGDFTFPGRPLANIIDGGLGNIMVFMGVVPHHVFEQFRGFFLGEFAYRLGICKVVEVHGAKLAGLVKAM